MTEGFAPAHIERSGMVRVAAAVREAFYYFTPDGERLWVPGWSPEYLHPHDGAQCEGAVFRTRAGGEDTLWMITRLVPEIGEAEYVRVTPDSRMGTVSIRCAPEDPTATTVHVTYRLTALSAGGNHVLEAFGRDFDAMMSEWAAAVSGVLER